MWKLTRRFNHPDGAASANPVDDPHRWTLFYFRTADGGPPAWEESKWMFEWDGSWNDIYVKATTSEDWNALFRLIRATWQHRYKFEGEPAELPEIWTPDMPLLGHVIEILVGPVTITCVHLDEEEIEMFIDPREIKSNKEFSILMEFMSAVSRALRKNVYMGGENIRVRSCLFVEYS